MPTCTMEDALDELAIAAGQTIAAAVGGLAVAPGPVVAAAGKQLEAEESVVHDSRSDEAAPGLVIGHC